MASTDTLESDYRTGEIKIHSAADFEGMRKAGNLGAECLDMLIPHVVPGVVKISRPLEWRRAAL
jgi:methionyl aminopeptidase